VAFTVLVVCTGNIARSPMTELLMRAMSDPRSGLVVSSVGVHALVGQAMDPGSAAAMSKLGLDPGPHRARQFEPSMAVKADLILTAERYHRETVLHQAPTALRRTFTIKEFARIAQHVQPGTPKQVVARAAAARGLAPAPDDEAADDVADPHGQPVKVNLATARELALAVHEIVTTLGLGPQSASAQPSDGGSASAQPSDGGSASAQGAASPSAGGAPLRRRPKPYRG
jgi:protein-tyrosine phosphatase